MNRSIRVVSASLALLVAPARVLGQDAGPAQPLSAREPVLSASRLDIRSNPFLSFHMMARAGAAGMPVPEIVRPAVEAIKVFSSDTRRSAFDAVLARQRDPEDIRAFLHALAMRQEAPLSEHIFAYANAIADSAPAFLAEVWPEHEDRINMASKELNAAFDAHGPLCIARICELLGLTDPRATIPAYLVTAAPAPGGFSVLSREDYAIAIVSTDAHQGTALVEAVLHEAVHVLDVHTRQQQPPSVLHSLRKALADAGVAPSDPLMRDVPHTLIFAAAAEVTREVVDPKHVAYGETGGYYAKVPQAAEAVLPAWERYVAGKLDAGGLIAEIVKSATKPE